MPKIIDIEQLPLDAKGRRGWLLTIEGYPHKLWVTTPQFFSYAAIQHAYLKQVTHLLALPFEPLEPLTQQEWLVLSSQLLRRYGRDHAVHALG
jgi:hypothetical protein